MHKLFLSFFLTGLLLFCFSRGQQTGPNTSLLKACQEAEKIFRKAEQLLLRGSDDEKIQAKIDKLYQQSIIQFKQLTLRLQHSGNDSIAFFVYIKTGFIEYYFDSTEAAKKDYLAAIELKQKLPSIADSFLFSPLLFTGAIYYGQNQFDSALSFYKKAEKVNDLYKKPLHESQRLYNRLGVMYYETGNYRQARNYFEKAITILSASNPAEKTLLVNYKINIASILVKLEDFARAQSVYESILPYNILTDEINHNLGIINFKLKDYPKALAYFKKVNYTNNKRTIDLYYNFGMVYAGMNEADSAELYFQKALTENVRWNGHKKNVAYGLILKYQADELARQQHTREAALQYQQAIIQFTNNFADANIYKNPEQYSGVFSYINLFNTLAAKAEALETLYQKEKDIVLLEASLDAYRSAFKLTGYVERTYTSDEARLFLGKIKYIIRSKPIDISLQLFNLTKKRNYLEEAYFFDQSSKASVLSFNVQENELKKMGETSDELLARQSSFKSNITRMSIKAAQTTDSLQLSQLNAAIRDNEIELGKIEEQINSDPLWRQKRAIGQIPLVNQLQRKLDNTTALLSFHLSENELLTLVITADQFEYHRTVISKNFFTEIEAFKEALQNTNADLPYSGTISSISLYQTLISPVQSKLTKIKKLIIIPDDELNYLPFEALQDENNRYLIENFSIQYQYSTALLGKEAGKLHTSGTLAFAPFASYNYSDSNGNSLNRLPASSDEINNLPGKIFIDTNASKNNFLQSANHYSIIHLATHASVNNEEPFQSFIAFNPTSNDYKLYAQEIYNLTLDSTQLVILSACETGTGKLIKGEGLMSLSRAFAYAGCPNIITSLWKAEDKTTSFITQRLHYYLGENYSKDKALQQAKLDLLHSNEIDPRLKTPTYWAHLIFIGSYEPDHKRDNWKWVAIGIIAVMIGYQFAKKQNLTLFRRQARSS